MHTLNFKRSNVGRLSDGPSNMRWLEEVTLPTCNFRDYTSAPLQKIAQNRHYWSGAKMILVARPARVCLFVLLCLWIVSASALAQYLPDMSASKVVREEEALSLIRSSLGAMNPTQAPQIIDLTGDWKVIKWAGKEQSGSLHEEAIGSSYRLSRMILDDGTLIEHWHVRASGYEHTNDSEKTFADERSLQTLAFTPALLLEELLNNQLDSIRPSSKTTNGDQCITATIREVDWVPERGLNGSTQISVCLDSQSHLVTREFFRERYDGDPQHTRPLEIDFSGYKSIQAWLLPQSETVRNASQVTLDLVAVSGSINSGLIPSAMPPNK